MKCQILFSGTNKKNISKCRLLKILPRVLSVRSFYAAEESCLTISMLGKNISSQHLEIFLFFVENSV